MAEIASLHVSLADVNPALDGVLRRAAERSDNIEDVLRVGSSSASAQSAGHRLADRALRLLDEDVGMRSDACAVKLGITRRRLQEHMIDGLGLPFKTYARLVRAHKALSALRSCTEPIHEIALASGYYDQSHMTNELRTIAGATPRQIVSDGARTNLQDWWSVTPLLS